MQRMRKSGFHGSVNPARHFGLLSFPQAAYHIDCTLVDHAICPGSNVGFSHWRSSMRGIHHPAGGSEAVVDTEEYVVEALAVHVFKEDGKMADTWLLRSG